MKKIETAQIFIGGEKVYEVLEKYFSSNCLRIIHTDNKIGIIVLENNRHNTLRDLVKLSELYPRTYVKLESYYKTDIRKGYEKYIIKNGTSIKIDASHEYFHSYLKR